MPKKVVENFVIDYKNHELRIDGEVFPYHLTEEPVIGRTDNRVPTVTITIPAASLEQLW